MVIVKHWLKPDLLIVCNLITCKVKKAADTSVTRIILYNKNTAKGIKASVAKELSSDDYKQCQQTLQSKTVDIKRIGSDHHNLYTYNSTEVGLSAFNTKRWICEYGISTLTFGHRKTLVEA